MKTHPMKLFIDAQIGTADTLKVLKLGQQPLGWAGIKCLMPSLGNFLCSQFESELRHAIAVA